MNYPEGVVEFEQLIEEKLIKDKDDSRNSRFSETYKPVIGVAIEDSKVVGITTTRKQLTRLLNRRGLVRPYVNPRGRGVVELAKGVADDLVERFGAYLPICELKEKPEEEVTYYEEDTVPTAVIGLKLVPSLPKIIGWVHIRSAAMNDMIADSQTFEIFNSNLLLFENYLSDKESLSLIDKSIVRAYADVNSTEDEDEEAFLLRIVSNIKQLLLNKATVYSITRTFENKLNNKEEITIEELDKIIFEDFVPLLMQTSDLLRQL